MSQYVKNMFRSIYSEKHFFTLEQPCIYQYSQFYLHIMISFINHMMTRKARIKLLLNTISFQWHYLVILRQNIFHQRFLDKYYLVILRQSIFQQRNKCNYINIIGYHMVHQQIYQKVIKLCVLFSHFTLLQLWAIFAYFFPLQMGISILYLF